MKSLLTLVFAMAVGCGAEQNQTNHDAQKNQKPTSVDQAQNTKASEVQEPEMIMARIAVDAEGNEIKDSIETVVVNQDHAEFSSAEQAQQAFEGGEKLGLSDELDADSSTDSWHRDWQGRGYRWYGYWNTGWYPGKAMGRGLWWGRNPNLWYGNGYQSYHYRHRYSGHNYRYYCWSRYRTW